VLVFCDSGSRQIGHRTTICKVVDLEYTHP
jgi:hypothetical protein